MRIHHLAVWTHHLEALKDFYVNYFQVQVGPKYTNPTKQFESYFLTFDSDPQAAKLELMQMPGIPASRDDPLVQFTGLIHFSVSAGSKEAVDALTGRLQSDGYRVTGLPRWTGDGFYESVILDPDGNRVEITI